jgi:nicotinate-nucleotide adenylyltransferase
MLTIELLYGGTFDPLHQGHIQLVKNIIHYVQLYPNKDLSFIFRFLPCAYPPLKTHTPSPFFERVKQLENIFIPYFLKQNKQAPFNLSMLIDQRESKLKKTSYTIKTLKDLHHEFPKTIRYFILGADNFLTLNQWIDYQDFFRYCHLLVINRPTYNLSSWDVLAQSYGFVPKKGGDYLFKYKNNQTGICYYLLTPEIDVSSTQIRKQSLTQ